MFLSINPAVLDRIIGLLTPLFLCSSENDVLTARHAADRLLGTYNVQTEEELRLAAEIIAFGFGALDALSQSMAPGLTVSGDTAPARKRHRPASLRQPVPANTRAPQERRIVAAELASKRLTPKSSGRRIPSPPNPFGRPTTRKPRASHPERRSVPPATARRGAQIRKDPAET